MSWKSKCSQLGLLLTYETICSFLPTDDQLITDDEGVEYVTRKII